MDIEEIQNQFDRFYFNEPEKGLYFKVKTVYKCPQYNNYVAEVNCTVDTPDGKKEICRLITFVINDKKMENQAWYYCMIPSYYELFIKK